MMDEGCAIGCLIIVFIIVAIIAIIKWGWIAILWGALIGIGFFIIFYLAGIAFTGEL